MSEYRPLSVREIFRIGIGPSSSHTVGPMRAAKDFLKVIDVVDAEVTSLEVELYGSLAATGPGHGTDRAVILGLSGYDPDAIPESELFSLFERVSKENKLILGGKKELIFDPTTAISFQPNVHLPYHVNGLQLIAHFAGTHPPLNRYYYSVGGGFVMRQTNPDPQAPEVEPLGIPALPANTRPPHLFTTAQELLEVCQRTGLSISEVMWENELATQTEGEVRAYLDKVWDTMTACIRRGCTTTGYLPGPLGVRRRAPELYALITSHPRNLADPLRGMDYVDLYALAVNEENAAGGTVVTAPTNGAAGVVPAVLHYLLHIMSKEAARADSPIELLRGELDEDQRLVVRRFLLAATAIASLIKRNASIAGAEVGCQGEVGSASAMAAAGLAEARGGTPLQVENAAEIAMEHSLGLTCDPVGGLVQIPCIERNAVGAVKAINAARMALWGDGRHHVSLDQAIETMRQTGLDMLEKYKETSRGGLAVNVVEC